MNMFITRAYNRLDFCDKTGTIIKRSQEKRLKNEIEHYKNLPKEIKIWFPRLINSGFDKNTLEYFLELEFYAYNNLGMYLIGEKHFSNLDWKKIAQTLNCAINSFANHKLKSPSKNNLIKMYEEKTVSEYFKLKENFFPFNQICQQEKIVVNDKEYLNFELVWSALKDKKMETVLYKNSNITFFHGDFCMSNILIGKHSADLFVTKFLDPRGKFGKKIAYGDCYYDIAKLMHSTDGGYEYFINDKFKIATSSNFSKINLTFNNNQKEKIHKIFLEEIYSNFDLIKANLIQGCIFIGMCARHYDSKERQIAMYATGVQILNETLEQL